MEYYSIEYVTIDGNKLVVLSKDLEGNGFSPLPDRGGMSEGRYVAYTGWFGELLDEEDVEEYTKEGGSIPGVDALVLWPTN